MEEIALYKLLRKGEKSMYILIAVIAIIIIVAMFVISIYNKLVTLKQRVANAWAQIDVQLKLRIDLIPNFVETVKGYAKHESETLENVIKARNIASGAVGVDASIDANNQLTGALKTLFAVTEAYPDLKANENFLSLQTELGNIENKIALARAIYNDIVMKYNTQLMVFPSNIIAGMFNFKEEKLFEATAEERIVPTVKF